LQTFLLKIGAVVAVEMMMMMMMMMNHSTQWKLKKVASILQAMVLPVSHSGVDFHVWRRALYI